jgi:DNA-binding response OmpR family regulator
VMSDESSRRLMNLTFDASHPQAFVDRWLQILSAREAKVLELLTRKPGSIVPKKLLERQLFGRDDSATANALEVFIHRLRKKLIERGVNVQIRTVFGAGYRIVERDRHDPC